jgi:hypothetical protein
MRKLLLTVILLTLTSCQNAMVILDGATHAKGSAHIEGYFTDSQADVDLCKVPDDYTPEQAAAFCNAD